MATDLADYAGLLSPINGSIGKMGQDFCLMAQQEINEIKTSRRGASSAMPHKQNPVRAEQLVTLARFNAVMPSGRHNAIVHEQERSGAGWMLEWMILPQMAQKTARAVSPTSEICQQINQFGSSELRKPKFCISLPFRAADGECALGQIPAQNAQVLHV